MKPYRKAWLLSTAVEFIGFFVFGGIWLLFFTEWLHVFWLVVPVGALHILASNYRRRECRCPHCNASLLGFDGDNIFAKKCENCDGEL